MISLPVSLGEAIDKLTILDIKLDRIKDSARRKHVETEYNILRENLAEYTDKYSDLYGSMKKVNSAIWDMMDKLRDEELADDEYLRICKECIVYNDVRFRIKNKVNYVSGSLLREQKGYMCQRLVVEIAAQHLRDFVIPIKYYSFLYDEIVIVYSGDSTVLKETFEYDPTIKHMDSIAPDLSAKKTVRFTAPSYTKEDIYRMFELDTAAIDAIL